MKEEQQRESRKECIHVISASPTQSSGERTEKTKEQGTGNGDTSTRREREIRGEEGKETQGKAAAKHYAHRPRGRRERGKRALDREIDRKESGWR